MRFILRKLSGLSAFGIALAMCGCAGQGKVERPWMNSIRHELGYLGARNWVVIAEAAFPVPSRRGLRVVQVNDEIPGVLDGLEQIIEEKHHVKPRIYLTTEMAKVPYDYAPGIKEHKADLKQALHGRETVRLDNEMLVNLINSTSKSYRVLVIKTRTAIPYSSVFVELRSGYWDADSEAVLRKNMEAKNRKTTPPKGQ